MTKKIIFKKLLKISLLVMVGILANGAFAQLINKPAPLFSGTSMDGKTVQLSDYKGKVVLLDIWASWCGPCKKEMPFLIDIDKRYRDKGLVILAVNIDKDVQNIKKFISCLEVPPVFPVIIDNESKIPPLYQLKGMPTTVLIDREGLIRYRHTGFKDEKKDEYLKEISTLLGEKSE